MIYIKRLIIPVILSTLVGVGALILHHGTPVCLLSPPVVDGPSPTALVLDVIQADLDDIKHMIKDW